MPLTIFSGTENCYNFSSFEWLKMFFSVLLLMHWWLTGEFDLVFLQVIFCLLIFYWTLWRRQRERVAGKEELWMSPHRLTVLLIVKEFVLTKSTMSQCKTLQPQTQAIFYYTFKMVSLTIDNHLLITCVLKEMFIWEININ